MQAKIYEWLRKEPPRQKLTILCDDDTQAHIIGDVVTFLGRKSVIFPDFRAMYGDDLRSYREEVSQLLLQLETLRVCGDEAIIIAPLATAVKKLPHPRYRTSKTLTFGDRLDLEGLKKELLYWGYEFVDIVEQEGEVSFRGDIIDLFPLDTNAPYRLSLFDTDIESIRTFDVETQKSTKEELESLTFSPALFALDDQAYEALCDRIAKEGQGTLFRDIRSLGLWYLDETISLLEGRKVVHAVMLDERLDDLYAHGEEGMVARSSWESQAIGEPTVCEDLVTTKPVDVMTYHRERKRITLIVKNESQIKQEQIDTQGLTLLISPIVVNIITNDELIISLSARQKVKKTPRIALMFDDF